MEMMAASLGARREMSATVGVRAVALPTEHGGWGLVAEPLLLGLCVAPSSAGVLVATAVLAAFLWRHPARLAVADLRRGVRYPRTRVAVAAAGVYALVALAAGVGAVTLSKAPLFGLAAMVAPFASVYLAYDVRLQSRQLVAELAGALALSVGAPVVARAAGWNEGAALGLWVLIAGRSVPAVLDVRGRLRRARGVASPAWPAVLCASVFTLGAMAGARTGLVPAAAVLVSLALLARIVRQDAAGIAVRPRDVGWQEVRAGLAAVAAWTLVYWIAA
jgi:hypothetical protein